MEVRFENNMGELNRTAIFKFPIISDNNMMLR